MGFWFQLMHPLMTGLPVALFSHQHPAPPVLPTPATVIDAIRKTKATTVYSVPAFLEVNRLKWELLPILIAYLVVVAR
jgi:acyl-coenzyme A synthetase/AMP-(fatty) acid ligase